MTPEQVFGQHIRALAGRSVKMLSTHSQLEQSVSVSHARPGRPLHVFVAVSQPVSAVVVSHFASCAGVAAPRPEPQRLTQPMPTPRPSAPLRQKPLSHRATGPAAGSLLQLWPMPALVPQTPSFCLAVQRNATPAAVETMSQPSPSAQSASELQVLKTVPGRHTPLGLWPMSAVFTQRNALPAGPSVMSSGLQSSSGASASFTPSWSSSL
ncbi:MAG: hypothetical protein CVT68_08390 [Actinobacteria bacterium HGW-Actinobacteria-8]|nr:MAG: hypothetical protein CVT68_08390 [Actinobacteria bacterium HGW-Actinobacteria-8]